MWIVMAAFGLVVAAFAAPSADAHPGVGIVMDRRGNVYYTDLARVWRIATDGKKAVAVPKVHTHELFLDADDYLFGEHLWYEGDRTKKWGHRVWRLAPDGTLTDVIPPREGFLTDYSFVRDLYGTMYWAERVPRTMIRKRPPSGPPTTLAECPDCRDVRWMTVTGDGTVYFIDDGDLREVTPAGVVRTVAKDLGEKSVTQALVDRRHLLMGLFTDAGRNVYVAAYGARSVKRISQGGKVAAVARSTFPWAPTGGLVAPNGDLWILEYSTTDAVRVRRIDRQGHTTTF